MVKKCTKCGKKFPKTFQFFRKAIKKYTSKSNEIRIYTGFRSSCRKCGIKDTESYARKHPESKKIWNKIAKKRFYSNPENREKLRRYLIEYIKRPYAKKIRNEAVKKYRNKFPERYVAGYKIRNAIRCGKIKVPKNCFDCKIIAKLDAHHHAGYHGNNWSKVHFICRSCHEKRHHPLSSRNNKLQLLSIK